MPVYFSKPAARHSPYTLWVDDYAHLAASGRLPKECKESGYATYVKRGCRVPDIGTAEKEEAYLASLLKHYQAALEEVATRIALPPTTSGNKAALPIITEELTIADMAAARRPSLLVNGLPSVQEDTVTAPAHISSPPTSNTAPILTTASTSASPKRDAARLNMLRRMRPPPLQYAWTFYHDKHSSSTSYEGRLTVLLENIITLKPFWEAYNRFPLDALKMKDSVHFFKRGVKPVWEDPRNVKGGAWTFRVPKEKSEQTWKEVLLLAVGEQFADVIEPRDDLCGISLSIRFNSNLITIWNRNGDATKSIEGFLNVLLSGLSPEIKPKEGTYYYKKHSEHAGFSDVVARAAEDAITSGKIEEAKVGDEEVERALEKEVEEEESKRRDRAGTA